MSRNFFMATILGLTVSSTTVSAASVEWCKFYKSSGKQVGTICYSNLKYCQRSFSNSIMVCIAVQK